MKSFKGLFLFIALSLIFSPQVFAARGVDYNGQGQPITISEDATGLKITSGKTISVANGSTFLAATGVVTTAGAITSSNSVITGKGLKSTNGIVVDSGSVTITAGNLKVTNGDINVSGTANVGYVSVAAGGGVDIAEGDLAITTGSIVLGGSDSYIQCAGKIRLYGGGSGDGYVDFISGTATARAGVRLLKSGAGDGAPIGSFYISRTGKIYVKIANAHADADWQVVTTTDAD